MVARIFKSRMGGGPIRFQASLLWKQLKVWIRETGTLSTFKIRLKTFVVRAQSTVSESSFS